MIFPVLSYFNNQIGPKVLLLAPELRNSLYLNKILALMDLNDTSFFIHEHGSIKTANLFFEIQSPLARGRVELAMLSLICFDEECNLRSFREIMEFFVDQIKKIPEVYKAFHYKSNDMSRAKGKLHEIANLFHAFNQSLPKEKDLFKQNTSRILMYGLSQSGKNSIMENLKASLPQSKQDFENPLMI